MRRTRGGEVALRGEGGGREGGECGGEREGVTQPEEGEGLEV